MRLGLTSGLFAFCATAVLAQSQGDGLSFDALTQGQEQSDVQAETLRVLSGNGARLKGLDKVSGDISDLELSVGESATVGRLEVTLTECRYPENNATGEAYAWLDIRDTLRDASVFQGWMVASSPALNALDHARYDVWVIRCTSA